MTDEKEPNEGIMRERLERPHSGFDSILLHITSALELQWLSALHQQFGKCLQQ